MGAKLPVYQEKLTGVVLSNGPEAIDLAEKAAEYYRNADHGYDAIMASQGKVAKDPYKKGWEDTTRKSFCDTRESLIIQLKNDNPLTNLKLNSPGLMGHQYRAICEQRADDMIGEALKKYKCPAGHSYRPDYDYKPEQFTQGCSR